MPEQRLHFHRRGEEFGFVGAVALLLLLLGIVLALLRNAMTARIFRMLPLLD